MDNKKQSWIVTVECVVTKEVVTSECIKKEAMEDPFEFAEQERETGQQDWSVKSIEPND